jgi:hypothetical protein
MAAASFDSSSTYASSVLTSPTVRRTLSTPPTGLPTPDYKKPAQITPYVKRHDAQVGRWKKRHLEMAELSAEPMFGQQIPYGGNSITDRVIQFRKDHPEISVGRNVSLILYKPSESEPGGYVISSTRGWQGEFPHAEMIALDKLPASVREQRERIRVVYTERRPCGRGCGRRNCAAKIAAVVASSTQVLYSFANDATAREGIQKILTVSLEDEMPSASSASPDSRELSPTVEESGPAELSSALSIGDVERIAQSPMPDTPKPDSDELSQKARRLEFPPLS